MEYKIKGLEITNTSLCLIFFVLDKICLDDDLNIKPIFIILIFFLNICFIKYIFCMDYASFVNNLFKIYYFSSF